MSFLFIQKWKVLKTPSGPCRPHMPPPLGYTLQISESELSTPFQSTSLLRLATLPSLLHASVCRIPSVNEPLLLPYLLPASCLFPIYTQFPGNLPQFHGFNPISMRLYLSSPGPSSRLQHPTLLKMSKQDLTLHHHSMPSAIPFPTWIALSLLQHPCSCKN